MASACKSAVPDERGALWVPRHWPPNEEQIGARLTHTPVSVCLGRWNWTAEITFGATGMMTENKPNSLGEILIQLLLRVSVRGPDGDLEPGDDGAWKKQVEMQQLGFRTDVLGQNIKDSYRFVTVR